MNPKTDKEQKELIDCLAYMTIALLLIGLFLTLCGKGCSVARAAEGNRMGIEKLLDAIEQVESGGWADAVGDGGKAVGSFQIWKIYVDDVNRILGGKKYGYDDRWNPVKSRAMVRIYLGHYATERRLGHCPTFEDMSRIHNGGSSGWKKESTKQYWLKVKKVLVQK